MKEKKRSIRDHTQKAVNFTFFNSRDFFNIKSQVIIKSKWWIIYYYCGTTCKKKKKREQIISHEHITIKGCQYRVNITLFNSREFLFNLKSQVIIKSKWGIIYYYCGTTCKKKKKKRANNLAWTHYYQRLSISGQHHIVQ